MLAKTYFEREGLILAEEGNVVRGFVHAALGPTADGSKLDPAAACISMLCVSPGEQQGAIAAALIEKAEAYLRSRGATRVAAGEIGKNSPHYLGIYGGSAGCGILTADAAHVTAFQAAGYVEQDRIAVLQRELASFRPPVSGQILKIRRTAPVDIDYEASPANWWDACTVGAGYAQRFSAGPYGAPRIVEAIIWEIDPLGPYWKTRAAGIWHLQVAPSYRRQAYATYLLGDALKALSAQGYTLVEAQARRSDTACLGLFKKLGFREMDEGLVFEKTLA